MKTSMIALLLLAMLLLARGQTVPAPERLLPADTIAVLTVPDMAAARRANSRAPHVRLWSDPAMKAFVDHFWSRLESDLIRPIESDLGLSFSNYLGL
ncbi:MAG TPA: hypothetical protein DCY13_14770, partial [Verrucomicrobiales bacterium]|nr:hypothetical protein [Verrucomicrobiales bacterium]